MDRIESEIIKAHFSRLGKKGGKVKSDAKAAAARENAKKGGRPKKLKSIGTLAAVGHGSVGDLLKDAAKSRPKSKTAKGKKK